MQELKFCQSILIPVQLYILRRQVLILLLFLCNKVRHRRMDGWIIRLWWTTAIVQPEKGFSKSEDTSRLSAINGTIVLLCTYHIPPADEDRSYTVTLSPASSRCKAETTPLTPAPITATSWMLPPITCDV